MKSKLLEIINTVRINKGLTKLYSINDTDNLRDQLDFTSFDLAELTVRIEDEFDIDIFEEGIISTIGEIKMKINQ